MRILIADDNKQILSVLKAYAERSGYTVDTTTDGDEALYMAQLVAYDVLLLDVMMPGKDGFEICREVWKTSTVPILMITARGEDYDKIMGLDIGADDYIVKPFSPGKVMARIRAVLRRTENTFEGKPQILTISSLSINKETCVVTISGKTVALTKKEIDLLWMLASNPRRVFTRNLLLDILWGIDYLGDAIHEGIHFLLTALIAAMCIALITSVLMSTIFLSPIRSMDISRVNCSTCKNLCQCNTSKQNSLNT